MQLARQWPTRAILCEIDIGQRQIGAPQPQLSGQQRIAAVAVAEHMVARDGDEAQRLLARPEQPRDERSFGKPSELVVAHPSPRSAAMLAAYWVGPPRKAAVPATSTV